MTSFRIVYTLFKSFLFNKLNYHLTIISLIYLTLGCSLTHIHYLNPLIRLVPLILITDHCILLLHLFFISLFILLYSILSISLVGRLKTWCSLHITLLPDCSVISIWFSFTSYCKNYPLSCSTAIHTSKKWRRHVIINQKY